MPSTDPGSSRRPAVVPGHTRFGGFFQIFGVLEQPGEVVQRILTRQLAGMNQTHEQVTYLSAPAGFIKERIFPMQDGMF